MNSDVYGGEWEGIPVAVKCYRESTSGARQALQAQAQRESDIMGRLAHPNICRLWGVAQNGEDNVPCLVVERKGDSLARLVRKRGDGENHGLDLPDLVRVLLGAARALAFVHKMGVLHRDVCSNNVVLSVDG